MNRFVPAKLFTVNITMTKKMARRQKKQSQELKETISQILPVIDCSDSSQILTLMHKLGTARSVSYNKLGSIRGWFLNQGRNWQLAYPKVSQIISPVQLGVPAKLYEWTVNDTAKAINAQQCAAIAQIERLIWKRLPLTLYEKARLDYINSQYQAINHYIKSLNFGDSFEEQQRKQSAIAIQKSLVRIEAYKRLPKTDTERERDILLLALYHDPQSHNWVNRQVRKHYRRGHSYVRNQVVYQSSGYSCRRKTRHTIELFVAGLIPRQRVSLIVRSRCVIRGQIRLIQNDLGFLEVHITKTRTLKKPDSKPQGKIGLDKGYTEGFYTSENQVIAAGLGDLMTSKTERIASTNKNRYRLFKHAEKSSPSKAARIKLNNLGYQVKSRRLKAEKAHIQNLIRCDLRKNITSPTNIVVEDLSVPIKTKKQAKRINRKLNQWTKGELQESVSRIARETGSTLTLVNPAYTSQTDAVSGTLLGYRKGDRFIRSITGDVVQADYNASVNIRDRATDPDIDRYMRSDEVLEVLLIRTIRYLHSMGRSVSDALDLGWLQSKFRASALKIERRISPAGVAGTVKPESRETSQVEIAQ